MGFFSHREHEHAVVARRFQRLTEAANRRGACRHQPSNGDTLRRLPAATLKRLKQDVDRGVVVVLALGLSLHVGGNASGGTASLLLRGEAAEAIGSANPAKKKTACSFLSAFPMFVPSLSWQNHHFLVSSFKRAQ